MDNETHGRWLYAVGKHLAHFRPDHVVTLMYATRRASQEADLLIRLRGQSTASKERVTAFARDAGIPAQELLATLQGLEDSGSVEVVLNKAGKLKEVREHIFTEAAIFRAVSERFEAYDPTAAEAAVVPLLDLLSRLPLTEDEAVERVVDLGFEEADARQALELHSAFHLVKKRFVGDLGLTLVYNEYLWGHKMDSVERVLAGLGASDTDQLLALTEEIRGAQGRSIETLTAAPQHIVQMAVNTGILDTVTIERDCRVNW
jgi:hypothetical protein